MTCECEPHDHYWLAQFNDAVERLHTTFGLSLDDANEAVFDVRKERAEAGSPVHAAYVWHFGERVAILTAHDNGLIEVYRPWSMTYSLGDVV